MPEDTHTPSPPLLPSLLKFPYCIKMSSNLGNRAGFIQAPVLALPFIKLQPMASFRLLKLALLPASSHRAFACSVSSHEWALLPSPLTVPTGWAIRFSSSSELRSPASEPFINLVPAATISLRQVFLYSQVSLLTWETNAHASLPLSNIFAPDHLDSKFHENN